MSFRTVRLGPQVLQQGRWARGHSGAIHSHTIRQPAPMDRDSVRTNTPQRRNTRAGVSHTWKRQASIKQEKLRHT